MTRLWAAFAGVALLTGCVHETVKAPSAPAAAPLKVRRIAVSPPAGANGTAVSHEFVRQLVAQGVAVSEKAQGADAVLTFAVTDYKPASKTLVFLGKTSTLGPNGQATVISNPVMSPATSGPAAEGSALGSQNPQVVWVGATVAVAAKLSDARSAAVLWNDEASYEAVDPAGAMAPAVAMLVRSMGRVVPMSPAASK